jgi:hypothetical protein
MFRWATASAGASIAMLVTAGVARAQTTTPAEGDDEIIDDPLSTAPKPTPKPKIAPATEKTETESTGPELHLDVWARQLVDTKWTRDDAAPSLGEDVVRSRLRTTIGVTGGSFTSIRYALEVRLDLEARGKRAESGKSWPIDRATYLYEALPMAAYVEVPIGQRIRLRAGEQVVAWGRMDLASAADVLERRDLREPPAIDPSGLRLPTPTLRADVDLGEKLDATLAWTVVSIPHRFDLLGTSWSLVGPGVLGSSGPTKGNLDRIASSTDQTTFVRLQRSLVESAAPSARLDGGELAARMTAHVGGLDVGFTYGWVRTKLPVIEIDPLLRNFRGGVSDGVALTNALNEGRTLLSASYPRYHQFALDAEGTAGPFTLSWELGLTPKRPLFVTDPSGFPTRHDAALGQLGVRAQYAHEAQSGDTVVAAVELDAFEALESPPVGAGPYVALGRARTLLTALSSLSLTLKKKHVVELLPRYSYELDQHWTLGLAGSFFPRLRAARPEDGLTLADVTAGRDFGEAFVRYRR